MSLEAILKIKAMADDAIAVVDGLANKLGGLQKIGDAVTKTGERMTVGLTAPITAGLGLATHQAIGFESAMADVNKVLSDPPPQFDQTILRMTRDLPVAAEGLAAIAAGGAGLGVTGSEIQEFTKIVAQMSTAFDMSADQAGDSVARMRTVLSLKNMDEIRQVGDLFNHLSDNSGALASELIDVATRVGGNAKNFGLANHEIAALSASFIEMAPSPEIAATAINSMLPTLQAATKQTPAFQEALQELGMSAVELEQSVAENGIGAIQNFIGALGELDQGARAGVLKDLFGGGSDANLIATLAGDASILADNLATVANQGDVAGSMLREFEVRSGTTANQLQLLRNNATEVGITLGSVILPVVNDLLGLIRPMIMGFADFAQQNPGITRLGVAIAGILAAIGPTLIVVGKLISAFAGLKAMFAGGGALAGVVSAIAGIGAAPIIAGVLAVAAAGLLIYRNFDRIREVFGRVTGAIGLFVQGLAQGLAPLIPMILPPLQSIGQSLMNAFGAIATVIGSIIGGVAQFAQSLIPAGVNAQMFGQIVGTALALVTTGLVMVVGAVLRVVSAFVTMAANVIAAVVNMGSSIITTITGAMVGFVSAIVSGGAKAVGEVTSIGSNIISAITGIAGQMFSAGANIVGRLAEGIMSGIGKVTGAMSRVARAGLSMFPRSPVPAGPLRVLNRASTNPGSKIVEMLADGMRSAVSSGTLSNVMDNALGNISGAGGGEVPSRVLNNLRGNPGAKIVEMLAGGMRSAVSSGALSNVVDGALRNMSVGGGGVGIPLSKGNPAQTVNMGGTPRNMSMDGDGVGLAPSRGNPAQTVNMGGITLNISIGDSSGDSVTDIADALRRELPDVLDEIMRDRRRISYG